MKSIDNGIVVLREKRGVLKVFFEVRRVGECAEAIHGESENRAATVNCYIYHTSCQCRHEPLKNERLSLTG
jgi:hypothetical protein